MLVQFGNPAPVHSPGGLREALPGPAVTYLTIPDGLDAHGDPLYGVTEVHDVAELGQVPIHPAELTLKLAETGWLVTRLPGREAFLAAVVDWTNHSAVPPVWVWSDNDGLARQLSEWYGCPIGVPDYVEETHHTLAGPPGVIPLAQSPELTTLKSGLDSQWRQMFAGAGQAGATGTSTGTGATSMTDTGAAWGTTAYVTGWVQCGTRIANILSHSGTVLTIDRWYDPACVDEATEILTARGWKTVDDVHDDDLVLGFGQEDGRLVWEQIEALNIYPERDWDMIEMRHKSHSSLTTPNHRWPIETAGWGVKKVATSEEINTTSVMRRGAPVANLPTEAKFSDAFVELVGWFCTEGACTTSRGRHSDRVLIHQSMVNDVYVDRIRSVLSTLFGPPDEHFQRAGRTRPSQPRWRETAPSSRPQERIFVLNVAAGALLHEVAPDRVMTPEFVAALTRSQLDLLWETWIAGDGMDSKNIRQSDRARLEPLQTVLVLRGVGSSLLEVGTGAWQLSEYATNRFMVHNREDRKHVRYHGRVWCPTTPSGFWLARREGRTFVTGNSRGGAAGSTPGATTAYVILPSAGPSDFMGLSANAAAVDVTADTTLPGEITTAGGGLIRKICPVAHTAGTSTGTLTPVFTANGSDTLPVTIAKIGVSGSILSTLPNRFNTLLGTTAVLSLSGDQLTIASTITLT